MDSIGGFYEAKNDKLSMVYYHPKYQPIPQTQTPISPFGETVGDDLPFQPLFLCPFPRCSKEEPDSNYDTFPISSSPEFVISTTRSQQEDDHSILPLFWCNNKEFDVDGGCYACSGSNFGTDYYLCFKDDIMFHKECVQSPSEIKHPYHPEHSLQLFFRLGNAPNIQCLCCGRIAFGQVYYCTICEVVMHTVCAMKSIPFGGVAMIGGFHEVENDGELSLVYHHPKYQPIDDLSFQPLFKCPIPRSLKYSKYDDTFPISSSPEFGISTTRSQQEDDHSVLPMFWCNNKDFDVDGGCKVCSGSNFGTDYYFCVEHDEIFHKECVQSPSEIKHPYHPEHSLQLSYRSSYAPKIECLCCGRIATNLVYYCTRCDVVMHTICAMKSISFVVDQPKSHDHPLTYFPRQASLTCDVCGLIRKNNPTYVCLRCNFVAHNDCMYSPRIIKISRHHHRISYTSSLRSGEWSCGVCRKSIDGDYGAYTCNKCDDYAVHVRCALRRDVWDGVELQGVPEEDDITQDVGPFEIISEGVILHFLHDHHLRLEVSILYDEKKVCQACVLPIYEDTEHYSCMECDFTIHEICAQHRRRIQHALHPHPLTLSGSGVNKYDEVFRCNACDRSCGGFVYMCPRKECTFGLDVRCASICEPFNFQGHKHPLFLALGPGENPICQVCKTESRIPLNCIKCDFIVCIKCATLPYKAKYKHDRHSLTILWGEEVCNKDWCEVCERNLEDTGTKFFYWCNECCTTLHIACLFDDDAYVKPGQIFNWGPKGVIVLSKNNLSRPLCDSCRYPCQGKIYSGDNAIACSFDCARYMFYYGQRHC